jgi:hypothetical protein
VGGNVLALKVLPSGDLIAGGSFLSAGDVAARGVARWDGVSWSVLGLGMSGSTFEPETFSVRAIAALPNGDLVAGGSFGFAGGVPANNIARWDGAEWSPLGSGVGGLYQSEVRALAVRPDGELVVGGYFATAGSEASAYFARWTTHPACPSDIDCSGTIDGLDIFEFLNLWFALDPKADFDGVNSINVQDIFAFLNSWFTGC